MYRNSPKLILKVDLIGDKGIKISLILLDRYFLNYKHSNHFFSTDGFMIFRGGLFTIFKTGSISFPQDFQVGSSVKNNCTLNFDTEEARYKFLKSLKNCLVQWSKSEFWTGFNEPERVAMRFNPKVWILF